jgi:hypothetical protein
MKILTILPRKGWRQIIAKSSKLTEMKPHPKEKECTLIRRDLWATKATK